jgi:hypothetical protein
MKLEFDEIAYNLDEEVYHFEDYGLDWNEDLVFEKYDGYISYKTDGIELFEHPAPVIFQGDLDVVKYIDYPVRSNNWHVMSMKMYETLLSVGDFHHRVIPVAIVDWTIQKKDWFNPNGELRKEVCLWNYLVVQITEYLDIFDYEKSTYQKNPNGWIDISKYVFKTSAEDCLPPIFKIKEERLSLFVSAEARSVLRKNRINGTRFISLQGFGKIDGGNYIDVPIILPKEIYDDYSSQEQQKLAEVAWEKQRLRVTT